MTTNSTPEFVLSDALCFGPVNRQVARIQALWESAEHWLVNYAEPKSAQISSNDCACCKLYRRLPFTTDPSKDCAWCPIQLQTGQRQCRNTPYTNASLALKELWKLGGDQTPEILSAYEQGAQKACRDEYTFLVSLVIALGERVNTTLRDANYPEDAITAWWEG